MTNQNFQKKFFTLIFKCPIYPYKEFNDLINLNLVSYEKNTISHPQLPPPSPPQCALMIMVASDVQ